MNGENKKAIILLTESQIENLIEFIELEFIPHIREDTEVDNMEYVVDMCAIYTALKEEAGRFDDERA